MCCARQLSSAGVARHVDPDLLIDPAQVAGIIGLSNPRGVSVYRRRYADFPAPVVERAQCVLWMRPEVEAWAREHGRA